MACDVPLDRSRIISPPLDGSRQLDLAVESLTGFATGVVDATAKLLQRSGGIADFDVEVVVAVFRSISARTTAKQNNAPRMHRSNDPRRDQLRDVVPSPELLCHAENMAVWPRVHVIILWR